MSPHPKLASLAGPALRMQPDRRLARLAGEGSDPAFEEIVRRYRSRLVAFAAAIVPPHRAEDIVQESLARVYSVLRDGSSDVHLAPWLFTIVRNRALNAVRDEHVHVELDEQFDGVTPPPEILARRDEVAALVAGIKALPEAQRQALVGRELEGLSHEEIATRLGTSPTSVRGLIFRARVAMRHAAGALIPLPALRWLLADAPGASAGEALTGGSLAAAGVASAGAGGAGLGTKAGAVVVAAVLATGAGVGLRDSGESGDARSGSAQAANGGGGGGPAGAPSAGGSEVGEHGQGPGPSGGDDGEGRSGRQDGEGEDRSGPGGGDEREGDDDRSGPGHGGGEDGGSSGPGGGEADLDNSGPGSHSSGSGSSGSGSGGSGPIRPRTERLRIIGLPVERIRLFGLGFQRLRLNRLELLRLRVERIRLLRLWVQRLRLGRRAG